MKITIYALHLGVGGVENYVLTLANMLVEEHDVDIVSTYKMQEKPAFYVNPKVKITYLLEDLKPNKEELREALKGRNIINIIKELGKSLLILYLKKRENIKSIKACKSDVIISTRIFHNKLMGKYASKEIVKITGEHNHHNGNQKYIRQVIKSCKKFDYFIPISKELCEYYREPMRKNNVETVYIRFCIEDNPLAKKPSFETLSLISVGRMSKEKGIYDLLDVFELVHSECPDIKLHIVGDGAEYEAVDSLIREKGLTDLVILHGFRDKQYIFQLLENVSLYVMTSFTESFGIVLLEAMSCGIPCIAYSSAQGAHEIIEDGVNGFLIENRDKIAMKDRICHLLSEKQSLFRLSENSFATAEKFSYNNTKKAWLKLMNTVERKRENEND